MYLDRNIGIYVHIPFCVRKCRYCDFLSFDKDENTYSKYIEALKKEIYIYSINTEEKYRVSSIYIGGGTPSILKGEYIEDILKCIRMFYNVEENAEITIEVNPGTITTKKVNIYKRAGINRVSIGLQSANDNELKMLGRIHTYDEFLKTYNMFRNKGFDNISVDVMSAIPNQTIESYTDTLNKIVNLKPEHISSYSLIIEENTPFYVEKDKLNLPTEDDERKMYYLTRDILKEHGYERYEISNYALDGRISKHNSNYWDVTKYYYGFGIGASSYMYKEISCDNKSSQKKSCYKARYNKISDLNNYLAIFNKKEYEDFNNSRIYDIKKQLECDEQVITLEYELEEFMYLGLRKMEGISIKKFNSLSCNGKTIFDFYGDIINKYKELELLDIKEDRIFLTDKGIDVCNTIFVDFIDKVKFYD